MSRHSRNTDFRTDAFSPYTKALGELALAWNDFHENLAGLFWKMTAVPNGLIPYSIWYSSKSDRAQREMVRALAKLSALGHDIPDHIRSEILWLLGQADALEDLRNDALHSPLIRSESNIATIHELGHTRAKKLAKKDLLHEFNWFYNTTIVLREYVADICWYLSRKHDENESIPKRPSMPKRLNTNSKANNHKE
jgi:hypothetical protein